MVRDGFLFIIPLLGGTFVLFVLDWPLSALLVLIVTGFIAFFFRDPEREIPVDPAVVVSPADGKVIRLVPENEGTRLSIFLSVLDVHVNRAPIEGKIVLQEYHPGRFRLAFDDRASVENERITFAIENTRRLTFSLIAGLVARRIVSWKKEGDFVKKGDRMALIRFGSRVDILLPADCEPLVREGDRVRGGSSIIARWREE